jgi:hypothetical protein
MTHTAGTPRAAGARARRALLGDDPRALAWLVTPTALAVAVDLAIRGKRLFGYATQGKAIWASSLLISAAFWTLPLWLGARLVRIASERRSIGTRVGVALFFALFVLPFATMGFAGQLLYHRVFDAYMGRDTLRLGIALRGTVREWFGAWGGPWLLVAMMLAGVVVSAAIFFVVRRAAPRLGGPLPIVPAITFVGALVCFWTDNVDSRFLQAALPDACFVHGVVHALRVTVTGKGKLHQGMSLRTPAPLPPLVSARASRPNVMVILTESVRADATCSDPPPKCRSEMMDDVASDRIGLGRLTAQTPNTFSACMVLWTGLVPNVDFATAHAAPVLWELARAIGYRTAYVTSQNPEYEDFGAFVRRAGIDHLRTALDLGGMEQEQLGAPDERATDEMIRFVQSVPEGTPWFGLVQLSNTHAPYRSDPSLTPYMPDTPTPVGDVLPFHNHYLNSVRMQERTLAGFVRALRSSPRWDDTAIVFLSDHGEQFREHGGLYHNHSLFDEELRVPGFVLAGGHVLTDAERAALASWSDSRTYAEDVHETIVDLLGLEDARATLPYASLVHGRSLLRPRGLIEPMALLATSTGVWEPDDARFGVMRGDQVLFGPPGAPWSCFDLSRDPGEHLALPPSACGAPMTDVAKRSWPAAFAP